MIRIENSHHKFLGHIYPILINLILAKNFIFWLKRNMIQKVQGHVCIISENLICL